MKSREALAPDVRQDLQQKISNVPIAASEIKAFIGRIVDDMPMPVGVDQEIVDLYELIRRLLIGGVDDEFLENEVEAILSAERVLFPGQREMEIFLEKICVVEDESGLIVQLSSRNGFDPIAVRGWILETKIGALFCLMEDIHENDGVRLDPYQHISSVKVSQIRLRDDGSARVVASCTFFDPRANQQKQLEIELSGKRGMGIAYAPGVGEVSM